MAARDIKENNEKVDNSDGWYKDHKSATSIVEASGLNMWIEEIEENKLCQSGISKLETIKYVCVCVCVCDLRDTTSGRRISRYTYLKSHM